MCQRDEEELKSFQDSECSRSSMPFNGVAQLEAQPLECRIILGVLEKAK
jgi:hypothetical protein